MNIRIFKPIVASMVTLTLLFSVGAPAFAAKPVPPPPKVATQVGVTVMSNPKAVVDVSNLPEGYIIVKYTGGKKVSIKVQIVKSGGTTYNYDLNNAGTAETFPLTEGNGSYTVRVLEAASPGKYAMAYNTTVDLKLRNDFMPYLYPNQYVNFNAKSQVVAKAAELCKGKATELDKIQAIYTFVVKNISYDYKLAATVQAGYLPNVDKVLASKTGICFDYASVMSAMLRSQNIPCKLVIGYAKEVYHAWINVYIAGVGWVDKIIEFDGEKWTLMDPTYISSSKGSDAAIKHVTTPSNYVQKFAY